MVTIVLVCSSMIAPKCNGLDKTFGDGCKGMGLWWFEDCWRLFIWTWAQKSQRLVHKVKLAITCCLESHEITMEAKFGVVDWEDEKMKLDGIKLEPK